ncbi:unnamed protein product [Chilo suppressalis]|uniref:Peptidase S1 domain-containing protein n=1 Tax=Chilo suppressalis TaxID=168631 RepID=A0ABN8BAR6_CHISP|nr:unnamed protein product [Chilo suppressalis]
MGVIIIIMLVTLESGCLGFVFELESLEAILFPRRNAEADADPGLIQTIFPNLINIEMDAPKALESNYPWIARVTHSSGYNPHVCTASCIHERIFITSASCIFSLKVNLTSVIYSDTIIPALAFVLAENTTKQLFDDIGFIVVKKEYEGDWSTIDIVNQNRSGEGFKWFADWKLPNTSGEYKVVGFATDKTLKENAARVPYHLHELDVIVDINLCSTILSVNGVKGFYTPCYHSCTLEEHQTNKKCDKYHGVEGGAVVDVKAQQLLGVATWSAATRKIILPVGFSVPNSKEFYENYECAMRIKNDETRVVRRPSHYQSLCSD